LNDAELRSIQRQRRGLVITMGLIIVAMAVGFGVVVYPWDLVRLPDQDFGDLLIELLPLTALLLITVFFLADVTKMTAQQAETERKLLECPTPPSAPEAEADTEREPLADGLTREIELPIADIIERTQSLLARFPEGDPEAQDTHARLAAILREAERAGERLAEFMGRAGAADATEASPAAEES